LFGFSSWSLLVPQALEGVAAVALLSATVRRWSGPAAGLLAGAILALTPAAVLMFRFNHPDALLTLLLVAAAYGVTRALEHGSTGWLTLAGTAIGFAFLTKMLQGFLVLPAFALVYLVAAPTSLWRRITQLLAAGLAVVVSAGWWVTAVALWPASSRPYIGGSTNNSVLDLMFGYNGFGRLLGGSGNGAGGGGGGGGASSAAANSSFGGATGLTRLFGSEMGNEISWLLPAALVALVAGLWFTRRAPRTDRTRAALALWGGWLIVTGLVFSYMQGTIHPYYAVALAPAVAALVAVGGRELWQHRNTMTGRVGLAVTMIAAGGWSYALLARNASWHPELRSAILAGTVGSAVAWLVPPRRLGKAVAAVALGGVLAGLAGTGAYAAATAGSVHTGSIPSVGPASAVTTGVGGGPGVGPGGGGPGGVPPTGVSSGSRPAPPTGSASGSAQSVASGAQPTAGGAGGGIEASVNSALTAKLQATTTTWAAATVGDMSAANLQLASGKAVMAIGGWSGSDNAPTLTHFQRYVADGRIHYFVAGNGGGGGQGGGTASQITSWVQAHYTASTVGGQTVYDLTVATTS
jgi:4-amino-4-deoxy-L-arabinose transferase-like glycosyltransferase